MLRDEDGVQRRPVSDAQKLAMRARRAKLKATVVKLQKLLKDRDWSQSDLARHAGLNRDVVSKTMMRRSFPSEPSLRAMAFALGVPMEELSDVYTETDMVMDDAALSMHVPVGNANHAWLTVNKLVRIETAAKVMQLVAADDTSSNSD